MGSALHLRAARRLARIEAWERVIPLVERLRKERLGGIGNGFPLSVSMFAAAEKVSRSEAVRLYNEIHPTAIDELTARLSELIQQEREDAINDLVEIILTMMDQEHHVLVGEAVAVAHEISAEPRDRPSP